MNMMRANLPVLISVVAVSLASAAGAVVPDLSNSFATIASSGATVLVCPAGDGDRLDAAQDCIGGTVVATVTLNLFDIGFNPVAGYPAVDMWLQANGLVTCPYGSIADGPSDVNGMTTFSGTIYGGGCSNDASLNVYINPHGLLNQVGLNLDLISPDLNGDLVVNLTDLVMFVNIYVGAYSVCADYVCDGTINIADVATIAAHFGATCP
jgi:hypothetical protein